MKFILGKKLGLAQVIGDKGEIIPVTLIGAGANTVIQIKSLERDGYASVQVGADEKKANRLTKSQIGHFKALGNFRYVKEFKPEDASGYQVGDKLSVSNFSIGDMVTVSATSTGRGFQGVVKRHGFSGGPASHGHRDVARRPGSIGGRFPQRVLKGKRMAGRMGGERVTVKNLRVVKIDVENNILALRGAVPGRRGALVEVKA